MSEISNFIIRFILFCTVHSLFAAERVKNALHASEHRGYRLCYNVASLAMFGWVMSAYRHSEILYFAPGVWSLVMYLLQVIVVMILAGCLRQTGVSEFLGLAQRSDGSFISTGWYSLVRHPLYLFSILFMVLNPVMTAQWLFLTIMSTVYFIAGALIEERRLAEKFGDAYRRYQQTVPFLIPKPVRSKRHTSP